MYHVLLFYKYVLIDDPIAVRDWQERLAKKYGLRGRFIIAREGVNITTEGTTENIKRYIRELEIDPRFHYIFTDIYFKRSAGTGSAFPRLSVKVRPEIVSAHLGTCDIDPNIITGKRLAPKELHQWFEDKKEFYVVDMRNVYEHAVGHFEGSTLPPLENFRDLPKVAKQIKHLKNKTVVTVCTGGIRCEKASGYLVSQGFSDVYQLDGGIVTYMEQFPNEHFKGKLYVFDGRVLMGFYTDDPKHQVVGKCENCGKTSEQIVDCLTVYCGRQFVLCEECEEKNIAKNGKILCPHGCKLRNPQKILSPWKRLCIKTRYLLKG